MSEYTPTVEELAKNTTIRDRRVVALTREERTRGIAKIKADTLREAADAISLVVIPGSDENDNLATAAAQGWLTGRANRIEEEA